VRDVASAVHAALGRSERSHLTALIVADDVTSPIPPRELASRLLPNVPWRGPEPVNEWAPLVHSDRAREALGWRPQFQWRAVD
jgi:nucleoside-diphosphate-sugar epimerase